MVAPPYHRRCRIAPSGPLARDRAFVRRMAGFGTRRNSREIARRAVPLRTRIRHGRHARIQREEFVPGAHAESVARDRVRSAGDGANAVRGRPGLAPADGAFAQPFGGVQDRETAALPPRFCQRSHRKYNGTPASVIRMLAKVDQNCVTSELATTTNVASTNSAGITG